MRARMVERAMEGDDVAFTELVDLEGDRCNTIAMAILRDIERAQDAVQQAFLLAWRDLPQLRDPERFQPWLHRLLVRACFEESRRHRRWTTHVRTLPSEDFVGVSGGDPTIGIEARDALDVAFAGLSPEHRAVVILHHHVGLTVAEVAAVVHVPVGTAKSRLHYATRLLRNAILASEGARIPEELPA